MKKPLVLYLSSEVILSLGIGMVLYAQPFFFASAHVSDRVIGTLFAINSAVGALAGFFLGSVADKFGASRMWKLSTFLLALGYCVMSLTHQVSVWAWMTGVSGLGGALLLSTENVVLSALTSSKEKSGVLSKFVGMYMFVMGAGAIVSGLISAAHGFQTAMVVGSFTAIASLVVRVWTKVPDALSHSYFRWPSKRLWLMSGYSVLFGLAMGLLKPFITLVLEANFHLSIHSTSLVAAVGTFMVSAGSFTVSFLVRRFQIGTTLFLSFFASVVTTVGLALSGNPFSFVGLWFARTAVSSIPQPIIDATFLNFSHQTEFSQMFGVRVFGNSFGTSIGSYMGGSFLAHHALAMLLIVSAAVFTVAYGYLMLLLRALQHQATASPIVEDDAVARHV